MNFFSLLQLFKLFLSLATSIAKWIDKAAVEKAFGDALILAIGERADAADRARYAVLTRGLPDPRVDDDNRDNRDSGANV